MRQNEAEDKDDPLVLESGMESDVYFVSYVADAKLTHL